MAWDLQTAQRLFTVLLNLAVAVLTGASASRLWLGRGDGAWAEAQRRPLRAAALAGGVLALLVDPVLLWLESASMAEVPVGQAGAATWTMLGATHFGSAWAIGMGALALATAGASVGGRKPGAALLTLAALAIYWYARGMVSHADSEGDFSLPLLADWLHLGLTGLWVGEVLVAGAIVLRPSARMSEADRRARAGYVASLSGSATLALAGIFVTGLYAAWRNLGGLGNLFGNPYGDTLVAKLLLVGSAALLGGFNRFFVMPPWLACESAGQAAPAALPARFRRALAIEALVLLGVVAAAAWLASTAPPGDFG